MTDTTKRQGNKNKKECAARERRLAAREYYSMHVTHRAHLFNCMLVFAAAAGVAYTTALAGGRAMVAGLVAVVAALLVFAFACVNRVTLKKITKSKPLLSAGDDELIELYEGGHKILGMRDHIWKNLIHGVLVAAFLLAAYSALNDKIGDGPGAGQQGTPSVEIQTELDTRAGSASG